MKVNKAPPALCQWAIQADFQLWNARLLSRSAVSVSKSPMHLLISLLLLMGPSFLQKLAYHLGSSSLNYKTLASHLLPIVNWWPSSIDFISTTSHEDDLSCRVQLLWLTILTSLPKMLQYTHKGPASRFAFGRIIFLEYSSWLWPSLTHLQTLHVAMWI